MSAVVGPASRLVRGRSRRSKGRRRLYSLAKAHHRDDDSSGSSSGTDSDSDLSAHRSKRRPALASGRSSGINWEVWCGIAVGILGIGVLVYYLFFGSGSDTGSLMASTPASMPAVPATSIPSAASVTADKITPVNSGLANGATKVGEGASKNAANPSTQTGGAASVSSSSRKSGYSASQQSQTTTQAAQTGSKGYAQTYTGKSTFYFQNGNPGACGDVNLDEALICALQTKMYAKGKHCGRKIQITRTSGKGGQIMVTVADECPSCEGDSYKDLSTGAYDKLGTRDEGMFEVSWSFVD